VRPDLVFTRRRVAVFVDGCFWHGCPAHGNAPRANAAYWQWKLDKNRARDIAVDEALRRDGWTVLRLWEHVPAGEAAEAVATALVD
jgi:DNA mismatch endonuclease, patch repair protein